MRAKKRYLLLIVSCAFLAYCYFGGYRLKSISKTLPYEILPSFATSNELWEPLEPGPGPQPGSRPCRMETCFDFSRCRGEFRVYVYPHQDVEANTPISSSYMKVLSVIRESRYYTADPTRACLYVLALDTLDRDKLSSDFVRGMPGRLARLPYWNNGRNHLIFNLYSGSWPDYAERDLGFDPGYALLAQASMSVAHFRHGFDVSLPLFHKGHPERGGAPGNAQANNFPANKKYLLAFKGKRYVHGIGSETRNSLWHLHNENDMVLVTTCRHGKSWKDLKDERCDEDNAEYDR